MYTSIEFRRFHHQPAIVVWTGHYSYNTSWMLPQCRVVLCCCYHREVCVLWPVRCSVVPAGTSTLVFKFFEHSFYVPLVVDTSPHHERCISGFWISPKIRLEKLIFPKEKFGDKQSRNRLNIKSRYLIKKKNKNTWFKVKHPVSSPNRLETYIDNMWNSHRDRI